MTNWTKLKKAIADVIKTNGNQEITGAIMQQTLMSIVDNMGSNAQFGGVAAPSTVPADTDGSVFYLASTQGIYPNFSGIKVDASEMAVFTKNTAGTWVKTSLPIQHPTIKKPLLIGGNVAAVTKGTGVVLSVPTLNADGTETASELSIEAATPANNGAMTKDQVNTLKEVDDFYTNMTDFVVGDNNDAALINIKTTEQNSISLKYKTLDVVSGSQAEQTKTIPAVSPGNGTAGAAGMNLIHDIPYFFDFYEPDFTSLPDGSDITKILIPKFQTSYDVFDDLYTDVPEIQSKIFAYPKAGDRIRMSATSGAPGLTVSLWAIVTSAQLISNVYSVTVDYDGDTYIFAFAPSNDMATLTVPWSKVSSKRNIYSADISSLTSDLSEADIKGLLTPVAYRKYSVVYPVKPQTGDLMEEVSDDGESRFITIIALRNQENPDEYTDILIPKTGRDNRYTKIVLKNDLTSIQSSDAVLFENYRRYYEGEQLLALDTVKAETIESSISNAYTIFIKEHGSTTTAQLPKVGDLIKMVDETEGYVPVCEVLVDSDDVQHTRWFYKGKLYEVLVNTALTRVPEDPKVIIYNSKKIYDDKLLSLRDTTDVAQIKKAFTPKGYAQPMIPDNGDIVQVPDEGGYLIFSSVQKDEFYLYICGPQSANLIISILCRKDFTTAKTVIGAIRMIGYYYDGNALLSTEITTPTDIKLLYTPMDDTYGHKSPGGAEPPKIGDTIMMPIKTSDIAARGVVVDTVETNNTYITRWFYGGKLYEAEVTKDFTSIPKYGKVIYDTASGTLRDLYIQAGAKYNEATGYYELNGLTDITEEQMRVIYEKTWGWWIALPNLNGFGDSSARTNIPCPDYKRLYYQSDCNLGSSFAVTGSLDNNLEVLNFIPTRFPNESFIKLSIRAMNWMCQGNTKPLTIMGTLDAGKVPDNNSLNIGGNVKAINIKNLQKNIRFYDSKVLSKESVLYMINNSTATTTITIGLNKAVYDVMKDDADIIAALAEKTSITLIQNT